MDLYPNIFTGCLLTAGGMVAFCNSMYASYAISLFNFTEVILSLVVTLMGLTLLVSSLQKCQESEYGTDDEGQSASPFYYELEPIAQRRDLPPIPRDIGREYDPIILDRV